MVVLVKQDIGGFDIAMEDAWRVNVRQRCCELLKYSTGLAQRKRPSIEHIFERAPCQKGHHQVIVSPIASSIDTRNNVLVLECLHDVFLAAQQRHVSNVAIEDFDRHVSSRVEKIAQVDRSHASLLQVLHQSVRPDTCFCLKHLLTVFNNGLHCYSLSFLLRPATPVRSALLRSTSTRLASVRSAWRRVALVRLAPPTSAWRKSALDRSAFARLAPLSVALVRVALVRIALVAFTPVRLAPVRSAPVRLAPLKSTLSKKAPLRLAPIKSACARLAPVRSMARRSALSRSAPLRSAPGSCAADRSAPVKSGRVMACSRR